MVQPLERAQRILDEVSDRILAEIPEGATIFDAHTHLGDDIDGMRGRPDEMLAMFDRVGITGSFTFCLDEPDRVPAFSAANDRTLAYAAQAPDRIIPFVRLDLADSPIDEASRCLDLGARGIKLHPRAQVTPGVMVYRLDDRLFFANADYVKGRVQEALAGSPTPVERFVFDAGGLVAVDSTGVAALEAILDDFDRRGITLVVARAKAPVREQLDQSGLTVRVGADLFFPTVRAAVVSGPPTERDGDPEP